MIDLRELVSQQERLIADKKRTIETENQLLTELRQQEVLMQCQLGEQDNQLERWRRRVEEKESRLRQLRVTKDCVYRQMAKISSLGCYD